MTLLTIVDGTNPLRCECGKLTCIAMVGETQHDKASIQAAKAAAKARTMVRAPMFVISHRCVDNDILANDAVLVETDQFLIVQAREDV